MSKKIKLLLTSVVVVLISTIAFLLFTNLSAASHVSAKAVLKIELMYLCRIDINGETLFCNSNRNNEKGVKSEHVTISGTTISIAQSYTATLAPNPTLKIYNYSVYKTKFEVKDTNSFVVLNKYENNTPAHQEITITIPSGGLQIVLTTVGD